jgi:thiamine-monophosphate kinase
MPPTRSTSTHRPFDAGGPTLADVGEAELLRRLTEIASEHSPAGLRLGSGDDAAVWSPQLATELAITQDALVENRDFRRSWITPRQLGVRAITVALSDLAGMGASPAWCTATICAAGSTGLGDVLEIQRGLCNAAEEFGCAVVGGDVSDIDGPMVLDVCAVGTVPAGIFLRRDAARPGDAIVVTGTLGRAAAGLRLLMDGVGKVTAADRDSWLDAQLAPRPRVGEGRLLLDAGVRCGGDMSDGLLVEAERTAAASGCGAELWLDAVPVDAGLQRHFPDSWIELALGAGEDFELIAAVDPATLAALRSGWPASAQPLHVVGAMVGGAGVQLIESAGGPPVSLPPVSSRHYR